MSDTPATVGGMSTDVMERHSVPDRDRTLEFTGTVLGTDSSAGPGKERWLELSLFRTEGGSYVVAGCGRSVRPGEKDRPWAQVSETAEGAIEGLHLYDDDGVKYLTRIARSVLEQGMAKDDAIRRAWTTTVLD